jgi:CRISPR-associated protein Csx10
MRKYFLVTLLEDTVISHRAASTGGHAGLDYLPGATFLGAVAAALYDSLPASEQFTIFHSGQVRFSDGLPLSAGKYVAYPMPLCLHHEKYKEEEKGCGGVFNRQFREDAEQEKAQLEQYRGKFFSFNRQCFKPKTQLRMKTAVDFATGTAATGQLFGYSALPKGTNFCCKVEADEEAITAERFNEITKILEQGVRLGRSRSAEYGRVKVQALPDKYTAKLDLPDPKIKQGINIWLLSDAALQDENGQPILYPEAEHLGLPKSYELVAEKTFIRSRSYVPFNSHRKRRELERQVLQQGSVLCFSGDEAVDLNALQTGGIGLYRQYGLGRIWVNPDCLDIDAPKLQNIKLAVSLSDFLPANDAGAEPTDTVFTYLKQRQNQANKDDKINHYIMTWEQELKQAYQSALALDPHFGAVCVGPSKSQWGRIIEAASKAKDNQALLNELFQGERAICKENDPLWGKRIYQGNHQSDINNFRKWLEDKLTQEQTNPLLLSLVSRFARVARGVAEKSGCRQEQNQ